MYIDKRYAVADGIIRRHYGKQSLGSFRVGRAKSKTELRVGGYLCYVRVRVLL